MAAKVITSIALDKHFPLINKAILILLLVGGLLIATGVDVVQMGGKLWGRSEAAEPASSASSGELVSGSRPAATNSAGSQFQAIILSGAVMLGVVVLVFYVLSIGGRDAERMKEQDIAQKQERQPIKTGDSGQQQAAPEDTECNLASYKLFFPSPDAAAPALEQAQA